MRATTLFVVLLMCLLPAWANDAVITGVGGTWQPLKGEHKTIRMVREHVRMVVLPEYSYRVTADFVFHNDGPATSVLMGFPESGGGDIEPRYFKKRSGFDSFATWVDGRRVSTHRVFRDDASSDYQAHWVKRVRFLRGQTRRVRVRYRSGCGGFSNGDIFTRYEFTGGNWKGEVEESLLTVTFLVPGRHEVDSDFDYRNPTGRGSMLEHKRSNRFFYRWRHWQAEGTFMLDFMPLLPNPLAVNFDQLKEDYYQDRGNIIELPLRRSSRVPYVPRPVAAALYHSVPVMSARKLKEWLDRQVQHRKRVQPCKIHWNARNNSAHLYVGAHLFGFRIGKPHMTIDGKVHRLPTSPLVVSDRGYYHLYVPLPPIIKTLGGKVKVVPEQRRVWFHL